MSLNRGKFLDFVFQRGYVRRFTQDSPVLPDVWLAYAEAKDGQPVDLILSPISDVTPQSLMLRLLSVLGEPAEEADIGRELLFNQMDVVGRFSLAELIAIVIPLTAWWHRQPEKLRNRSPLEIAAEIRDALNELPGEDFLPEKIRARYGQLLQLVLLGGLVMMCRSRSADEANERLDEIVHRATAREYRDLVEAFLDIEAPRIERRADGGDDLIWIVNQNRKAQISVTDSRRTVKADASEAVFAYDTSNVTWAIVDSGINAEHPAFQKHHDRETADADPVADTSRVLKTYDFTRLRTLLSVHRPEGAPTLSIDQREILKDLRSDIQRGRSVDWDRVAPLIEVAHDKTYDRPKNYHGTHVAGIMGADWPDATRTQTGVFTRAVKGGLRGICPKINFYDLRVFDENGEGDEFTIAAALQFVRYLNRHRTLSVIQGVNLSFSIQHNVSNFACGQTPICMECERLVGQGTIVVSAAGNQGHHTFETAKGPIDGYLNTSITDPGNAEAVITVGATHRNAPHSYGVSYFSSRGPTGDGRAKPDLVAPGEKIFAPILDNRSDALDGTSMAAPHVSAAAAILIARYPELRGNPARIKEILCATATDLGRERYFQGAGMVNTFRALQAI